MNILEVKNLFVHYGPIDVIKGIDLNVPEGQIIAILGANGAGKSTLLKTISGLVKSGSGEIIFNGINITNKPAYKIAKMGLNQSPEGRFIFNGLTVEENLRAGGYSLKSIITEKGKISASQRYKDNLERVFNLFPVLNERKKQAAHTLSGGEQQMLAIGRALMASPKLLVLDEPSLGLAPLIIKDIFNSLQQIKKEGTTILIVEQNAYATLKLADYAYVLELGKINMQGLGDELLKDERLIESYLGGKKH